MANKVKYLQTKRLRSGQVKWAFNPPAYLQEAIGAVYEQYNDKSDAVMRCLEADRLFQAYRASKKPEQLDPSSVSALINTYKGTKSWIDLKPNSHRTYEQLLNGVLWRRIGKHKHSFGNMQANNVSNMDVEHLYQQLSLDVSVHRARHTVKVLKRIWNVGENLGKVRGNPFRTIELGSEEVSDVIWKSSQIKRFIDTADEMGYWSIGTLALLCYDLCQRPGDMRQLKWGDFDGQTFEFRQEKTGTKIEVDGRPTLIARLMKRRNDGGPDDCIVRYESTGKPYDNRMYNKIAAKVRNEAMLPSKLTLKCLRHTGATELGEDSATEDQIAAVTGHKSRQMLNIYVKKTKRMAEQAQQKRQERFE